MKIIYDSETDTLSLILHRAKVAESDELREGVIVDYDRKGRIVGIEILDASKHDLNPAEVAYEMRPAKAAAGG